SSASGDDQNFPLPPAPGARGGEGLGVGGNFETLPLPRLIVAKREIRRPSPPLCGGREKKKVPGAVTPRTGAPDNIRRPRRFASTRRGRPIRNGVRPCRPPIGLETRAR